MSKKIKISIITTAIIILAILVSLVIFLSNRNSKNVTEEYKYQLINNETNLYISDLVAYAGDFIYFNDYITNYYAEYDVYKDKQIQMPVKGQISDFNFYNGNLYCILYTEFEVDNTHLSIVKWDINTGNYETIYVPPKGVDGLYNFSMTTDGLMFFLERKPTSEVSIQKFISDPDGYNINYTLYIYDSETNEKTALAEGVDRYYIRGNRLYFDKVMVSDNTEDVFYLDFDDPDKIIDTGICCRTAEAVKKGYEGWFYVDDEYVYYSGGTADYYRRSMKTDKEELLFTYTDSEGYIARSLEFNGKQILYVRCKFNDEVEFGAKLFELDTETKSNENIWTDTTSELLGDYASFKNNNDFFYLSTYAGDYSGRTNYYIVYPDYTKKEIYRNSYWENNE
ncbi:hypothetical protein [Ruminococcus sp. Marseille-P6503]|uniref:hypothetical protein n=1 Tax=Ruminococcus sp. Marseille-P6503 TaxID=2364796 RepID=UPI000F54AB1F|nr:hypothetical protein [Ruminococcus sp. Marseille-P6503]